MTKRSTPSSPLPSQTRHASSTTLWKTPEPTDVLSYVYLWSREADQGREEGSKERPVVVVLATEDTGAGPRITVAPMTTRPPRSGDAAVEVPATVRRHLGLGDERCWIVSAEVNHFIWPGPDLRPARREGEPTPYYGKIPARLLEQVRDQFRRLGARRLRVTPRSE